MTLGDTWTWEWENLTTGEISKSTSITYLGGEDYCWSNGYCGQAGAWSAGWPEYCQPEDDQFAMRILFNGAVVEEYRFRPTRFIPKIINILYAGQIQPRRLSTDDPQATAISVNVQDQRGCGVFLEDVTVTMTSTIVSGSNEHDHIPDGARGTGRFESLGYDSEVDPDTPKTKGTVIEGKTDSEGFFQARYQAQKLAGIDTITIQPTRPHTDTLPPRIGDAVERQITVGFMGFQEITATNAPVIFADGGTCPGHGQLPHWLTPVALQGAQAVAQIYYDTTGNKLSLNDASLPLGGLIDNQYGGGRNAECHVSHRQGIDIDINKVDAGGALLRDVYNDDGELVARCDTFPKHGIDVCLDQYLNGLFYQEAFSRIEEGNSIHYRLKK